ncbi:MULTISPECIES: VOC family protein [Arthrobacter]|uniref:VOC family protein n=1 Tax=Arthrobacter oryzae TaxID=409290 RepID=A0A3N0BK28_9MICC|nr:MULTISPECIES: VOC family protein [Arthrobacter]QYF89423.1 VOC family protein [Arthrobacter sp. PAMC25284]RNL48783.1 VOC family protein [Arthrobacter oryzae]
MAPAVVHFEIPADDEDRAAKFYSSAFDWGVQPMPELSYTMITTTPKDDSGMPTVPGAINGGMFRRQGPVVSPVVTVAVDDIDEALGRIESLGGSTVSPRQKVGSMGWSAYFKDTEGNIVGLWQNAEPETGADTANRNDIGA